MAILDNLVSYYPLNEASGNALDAHSTNHLTETIGTIASATGKVGNARDFEAGDLEYFELADNADFSMGDIDFTLTAWAQLESVGANRTIIGKWNTTGAQREYRLVYLTATTRFQFEVSSDGGGTNLTTIAANSLGAPSTGVWYFIVCRHNAAANTISIQVNDGAVDSASHAGGAFNGTAAFRIGAGTNPTAFWDGLIDEVGVWKRDVTSGEGTTLYNAGNGVAYPFAVGGQPTHRRWGGVPGMRIGNHIAGRSW